MSLNEKCSPGSELYAQETRLRLEALQQQFERHLATQAAEWEKLMRVIENLQEDVQHAKHGRPTWFVTFVITTLASLCTGLLVRLAG